MLVGNIDVTILKPPQTNRQSRLTHPSFFQRFPYFIHMVHGDQTFTSAKLHNSIGYRAGNTFIFTWSLIFLYKHIHIS